MKMEMMQHGFDEKYPFILKLFNQSRNQMIEVRKWLRQSKIEYKINEGVVYIYVHLTSEIDVLSFKLRWQ